MFENLRAAFRQAVENFKHELSRDEVPDAVDRLLHGMREEVTDARAHLRALEEEVRRTRAGAERERREVDTCERRERMARRIGDEDTAKVAAEYAERHRERTRVLEEKAMALEKEVRLRTREFEEMVEQIKEAQERRDVLAAEVGRGTARESIRRGQDLFEELDRMAEKMGDSAARDQATEELFRDTDASEWEADLHGGGTRPPGSDLEERLAELKKRMEQE